MNRSDAIIPAPSAQVVRDPYRATVCAVLKAIADDTGFPYAAMMSEWFDPGKDAINRERHKPPLIFGDRVMADPDHLIIPSIRARGGEERFKAVGMVDGRLFTAVFTWRGDVARFISVRRSNAGEERAYPSSTVAGCFLRSGGGAPS